MQNDLNKALPRSPAEVVSLQFGKSLQTAKDDGNLVKIEMMRLKSDGIMTEFAKGGTPGSGGGCTISIRK
jgi:hypothetical protein